jgi:hypothetical protein
MLRAATVIPAARTSVTFRSQRTGELLAVFADQTSRQVEQLLADPPVAPHVAYDVRVCLG